jgi:TIR domain-containing protein
VLVQVFAHLPPDAEMARALATEWDAVAKRRAVKGLELPVPRGSTLTFHLDMPGAEVDDPVQALRWDGRAQAVQFGVTLPEVAESSVLIATVNVNLGSVPVGHVKFKLEVGADSDMPEEPVGDDARRYTSAFISYASSDRDHVLRAAQMLRAVGIRCFQDVLDLGPGERWERKLYASIREGDLFLLFWSNAAHDSEWVRKEARYALECKASELDPPEIKPIILERPPVPPWPELAHLHFDDPLAYFMSS